MVVRNGSARCSFMGEMWFHATDRDVFFCFGLVLPSIRSWVMDWHVIHDHLGNFGT